MTPERWVQVKELFHAALESTETERAAFLAIRCGNDRELLQEVTTLLRRHQSGDPSSAEALATVDAEEPPRSRGDARDVVEELLNDGTRSSRAKSDLEDLAVQRRSLQERVAGQFEIVAALGRGGGGVVFEARDLKLDRRVAIKCLHAARMDRAGDQTLREARHLATISHPNIAAVYTVSESAEFPFIVMEFIDGAPITEALVDRPLDQQIDAFRQVLRAVSELHRRGLVHRDLKPGNILLDRRGHVKLVDFGIACPASSSSSAVAGTPAYIAPEQCTGGEASPMADVFSLGVILFELLTGQRPFPGKEVGEILTAVREANPPLPRSLRPEIPGAVQAICLTALEKNPALRYPSAREFLLDIERFLDGEGVAANPTLLSSILDHGIERHMADLSRWARDRMISTHEVDYFEDHYDRLRQREEFWVLDSRRITFAQAMLHLGAWICVLSALLMLAFPWAHLGWRRPLLPTLLFAELLVTGWYCWRTRNRHVAVVMSMAAALVGPLALGTILAQFHIFDSGSIADDVLWGILTNWQFLMVSTFLFLLTLFMWRRTKTAAFALLWGASVIVLATAIFGLMGLRNLLSSHPSQIDIAAGRYLWPGVMLFVLAMAFDLQRAKSSFAPPLYILGLSLILLSITFIAAFGPTPVWLHLINKGQPDADHIVKCSFTFNGQVYLIFESKLVKCSFMFNGLVYLIAGYFAERSQRSAWLRRIGTLLFWLAPSHILIPLTILRDDWPIVGGNGTMGGIPWTYTEILLPIGALAFIVASVARQMKSFLFSGLAYMADAVCVLTYRHFEDRFAWPISLAVLGLLLAFLAWWRPMLFESRKLEQVTTTRRERVGHRKE